MSALTIVFVGFFFGLFLLIVVNLRVWLIAGINIYDNTQHQLAYLMVNLVGAICGAMAQLTLYLAIATCSHSDNSQGRLLSSFYQAHVFLFILIMIVLLSQHSAHKISQPFYKTQGTQQFSTD